MKPARSHHYVPQFYLRGFACPTPSRPRREPVLWVYERGKLPRPSTPRAEGFRRDYYAYEGADGRPRTIEGMLSVVESLIAPTFRRIEDRHYFFTPQEKEEMATFVALMFIRGPAGRGWLDTIAGTTLKALTQEWARDESGFRESHGRFQAQTATEVSVEDMRKFILGGEFEVTQKSPGYNLKMMSWFVVYLTPILASRRWVVMHAKGPSPFLACDSPVFTLVAGPNGEATLGMGFEWPGVEVHFPCSARTCLWIKTHGRQGPALASDRLVGQINDATMMCVARFLYGSIRSTALATRFDQIGCQVRYGVNALAPPGVGPRAEEAAGTG